MAVINVKFSCAISHCAVQCRQIAFPGPAISPALRSPSPVSCPINLMAQPCLGCPSRSQYQCPIP
ncbi:uncharacterized protein P884DRAFT_18286 [Thermothelomyces heterothallicus CBS 202.75]|uniref:uncharacterized protein n=1 Tax=Thermothelomyces heterothallicus CBS 202.75 TaxID=1149848 RepID=UPI003742ECF4